MDGYRMDGAGDAEGWCGIDRGWAGEGNVDG